MKEDEQLREWERMEEEEEYQEACRVANKNLWLCDDGEPMTPHPQSEYIITEDDLQRMTMWATNKGVCLYDLRLTIANKARSRPYTPAKSEQEIREKVLDQVEAIFDRYMMLDYAGCDREGGQSLLVREMLAELRKSGGEQR